MKITFLWEDRKCANLHLSRLRLFILTFQSCEFLYKNILMFGVFPSFLNAYFFNPGFTCVLHW